jgi:hypothetical protein
MKVAGCASRCSSWSVAAARRNAEGSSAPQDGQDAVAESDFGISPDDCQQEKIGSDNGPFMHCHERRSFLLSP